MLRLVDAPVSGRPVLNPWNTSLGGLMEAHGHSISEDATIDDLLDDLEC
jgi:hypothetical protein